MNILIVDDEKEIADLLELYLLNEGYEIYKFYSAKDALQCIDATELDLAILDVMLPETDGFSICQAIRKSYNFPIIMVTAKIEPTDKITGFTVGADDYITKPFHPLELVARVKAQLRRYTKYNEISKKNTKIIDFKGLVINKENHQCILFEKQLSLTPIEFSILWYLCENKGRVVSSEELFEQVWREKYLCANNNVMVHIRRVREKMQEPSKNPRFIKTVWGVGYTIED